MSERRIQMSETQTCSQLTYDRKCLRPVKDEGMCASHLAGKRRREKNDADRKAGWDEDNQRVVDAKYLMAKLSAAGITFPVSPEYRTSYSSPPGRHTGNVEMILDAEAVDLLIALVKKG